MGRERREVKGRGQVGVISPGPKGVGGLEDSSALFPGCVPEVSVATGDAFGLR